MAEFGRPGEPEKALFKIFQETLADMIGTTRSRVSFFMNRFRKPGFIEYNGRIHVNRSLLNFILHDYLMRNSLGMIGTLALVANHPKMFTAIGPSDGDPVFYPYGKVRGLSGAIIVHAKTTRLRLSMTVM